MVARIDRTEEVKVQNLVLERAHITVLEYLKGAGSIDAAYRVIDLAPPRLTATCTHPPFIVGATQLLVLSSQPPQEDWRFDLAPARAADEKLLNGLREIGRAPE